MAAPYYCVMRGTFVVVDRTPDGDSVRFIPDEPAHLALLRYAHRIRPGRDGAVQLRLEAADAPEVHYGEAAQPLGTEARDRFLDWLGFRRVEFAPGDEGLVVSASPETVRGVILSKGADANGRPISYVLTGDGHDLPRDGEWTFVGEETLARSLNGRLLTTGAAYPSVYTGTPLLHREWARAAAREARDADRGVWARDTTTSFTLRGQRSIGPNGQLILPKLFRRSTDYLKAVAGGFRGDLVDWLIRGLGPRREENDRVVIGERVEVRLSSLLDQRNQRVVFQADLLDLTFIEK